MNYPNLLLMTQQGIQRLTEVIEWLEAGAPHVGDVLGFNMSVGVDFTEDCGTTCCIAGALCQFNEPFGRRDAAIGEWPWRGEEGVKSRAQRLLGIADTEAGDALVTRMFRENHTTNHITPAVAAATLRDFLVDGELVWPEAPDDEEE